MKAVILAAGPGTRLRPLTDESPKCMIDVEGKSILERQIETLMSLGIGKFVFCVGPFPEKVKSLVDEKFPGIGREFVQNDLWESTNYIYTMWLARDKIVDDIILVHGDLVFEESLMKTLLDSGKENCVMVRKGKPPEKDFKALVSGGTVKMIGVDLGGDNAHFLPPLYKISKESMSGWMKEIGKFIGENRTKVYAENALNGILEKIGLRPVFYENEFCMEVDDFQDLDIARKHFRKVLIS